MVIATVERKLTGRPNRRWWVVAVLASFVLLVGIGLFKLQHGIWVTIENTGATPIRSVVLHVTGASYALADIAPKSSTEVRVEPRGESHLEIEFTDPNGKPRRLDAGGYFESGYRGTIRLSIKDGAIEKNEQAITLYSLY
jgi:hypothetical protein